MESKGAAKDQLTLLSSSSSDTYPFKNSHKNLPDELVKKPLTAALVKLKQRGVLVQLVYDSRPVESREVSCSRQREIR